MIGAKGLRITYRWLKSRSKLTRKWVLGLRRYDGRKLLQMITTSLGIIAAFHATQFFASKPSVELTVTNSSTHYNLPLLVQFYTEHGIEFPEVFHDSNIDHLFSDSIEYPDSTRGFSAGTSDIMILEKIKNRTDISGYLSVRISDLERHLDDSTYFKHFYMLPDWGGFYPQESIPDLIKFIESRTTREEYFTFLLALISSRITNNSIFLQNDGDVDLKEIVITIPAPTSKITEARAGNILHSEVIGNSLYEVENRDDRLIWHIPFLSKEDHIAYNVTTRDNVIIKSDIIYSFQSDQRLDINEVILTSLIVITVVFIIGWWLRGKEYIPR